MLPFVAILLVAHGAHAQSTVLPGSLSGTSVSINASSGAATVLGASTLSGTVSFSLAFDVEYLVVGGGGGGGGTAGGGGGAGGVRTNLGGNPLTLISQSYQVVVGSGGLGGNNANGAPGNSSSFATVAASGGGFGGGGDTSVGANRSGGSGASGGGGGGSGGNDTGAGGGGSGNAGGFATPEGYGGGTSGNSPGNNLRVGGGGGGAGGAGANATGSSGNPGGPNTAGNGGVGLLSTIRGTSEHFGGGGGGGTRQPGYEQPPFNLGGANTIGSGGLGGGGNGGGASAGANGSAGTANTGGGGGGGSFAFPTPASTGGNGGSGLVVVRYLGSPFAEGGNSVAPGTGSAAGYTVHSFTNTGTSTFTVPNLDSRLAATLEGNLSGAGAFEFNGPGVLTVTGSNSYSGGTTISAGTVVAAANSAFGSGGVRMNGGTLQILPGVVLDNSLDLGGNAESVVFTSTRIPTFPLEVEYLVVGGGGGGGGTAGGGGGAGGVRTNVGGSPLLLANEAFQVVVGAGGIGGANANGTAGGLSSFGSVTASGGGLGGGGVTNIAADRSGGSGGSGGGGGGSGPNDNLSAGGGGSGNAGGYATPEGYGGGTSGNSPGINLRVGGGGGGAGGAGVNAGGTSGIPGGPNTAGDGGIGVLSTIRGQPEYFGGGGGGGTRQNGWEAGGANTIGSGGLGGGGNGGGGSTGPNGVSGTPNTGGGGGGGSFAYSTPASAGGDGGSGLVIVRYQGARIADGGTVTTGTGSAAGYTIHTFSATGTSTFTPWATTAAAVFSGAISGTGGLTFDSPDSSMILSGSNTFTGDTTVPAGTLRLGNAHALGRSTFAGGAGALSFGTLDMVQFGGLSGSRGIPLVNDSATAVALAVGANNASTVYSGTLSGAGSLMKIGTGRLTLDAASNFTGATTISGGTIALGSTASLASSLITVGDAGSSGAVLDLSAISGTYSFSAGQTLGGIGTIRSALGSTIEILGTLSPGNSPGVITYDGGTTLLTGTTIMEIFGTLRGTEFDAIDLINGAVLDYNSGTLSLSFDRLFEANTSFQLFGDGSATLLGNFSEIIISGSYDELTFSFSESAGVWRTNATASGQSLEFSPGNGVLAVVPEPHAAALSVAGLAFAGLGMAASRRRRRIAPPPQPSDKAGS